MALVDLLINKQLHVEPTIDYFKQHFYKPLIDESSELVRYVLPLDLYHEVIKSLDVKDITNLLLTCKELKSISTKHLWKNYNNLINIDINKWIRVYLNHGDEIKCIINYIKKEKTQMTIKYDIERITITYNNNFELTFMKTKDNKIPIVSKSVTYKVYKNEQLDEKILFYKLLELYDNTRWIIYYEQTQRSYFVKKHQLSKYGELFGSEGGFPSDYKQLYYAIYKEIC